MGIKINIVQRFVLILLLLGSSTILYAQHFAVSGYIVDAETKETLIGASVYESSTGRGVVSDRYGFFQFAGLTPGKHILTISFIGYEALELEITLTDKSVALQDIKLKPRPLEVDEVSIIAASPDRAADRQVETSMIEISSKTIQSIPAAGNDVFSAIKFAEFAIKIKK